MSEDFLDVVFDGPPGPSAGRFVEVEDPEGRSVSVGRWIHRADGFWALRIPDPEDGHYAGGRWHRRVVELARLLVDATALQVTPCDHRGVGRPGCVTCDPRIRDGLGIGNKAQVARPPLATVDEPRADADDDERAAWQGSHR